MRPYSSDEGATSESALALRGTCTRTPLPTARLQERSAVARQRAGGDEHNLKQGRRSGSDSIRAELLRCARVLTDRRAVLQQLQLVRQAFLLLLLPSSVLGCCCTSFSFAWRGRGESCRVSKRARPKRKNQLAEKKITRSQNTSTQCHPISFPLCLVALARCAYDRSRAGPKRSCLEKRFPREALDDDFEAN